MSRQSLKLMRKCIGLPVLTSVTVSVYLSRDPVVQDMPPVYGRCILCPLKWYNGGFGQTDQNCIAVVEFAQNERRDESTGNFLQV